MVFAPYFRTPAPSPGLASYEAGANFLPSDSADPAKKGLPLPDRPPILPFLPARPDPSCRAFLTIRPTRPAMLETLRKHHYILMLFIAILVCVAFIFFGDYSSGPETVPNAKPLATMDGEDYYQQGSGPDRQSTPHVYRLARSHQSTRPIHRSPRLLSQYPGWKSHDADRPAIVQRYRCRGRDSIDLDFCMNVATLRAKPKSWALKSSARTWRNLSKPSAGSRPTDNLTLPNTKPSSTAGPSATAPTPSAASTPPCAMSCSSSASTNSSAAPSPPPPAEINARYAESKQQDHRRLCRGRESQTTARRSRRRSHPKILRRSQSQIRSPRRRCHQTSSRPTHPLRGKTHRPLHPDRSAKASPALPSPQPEDTSTLPEDQKKAKEEEYKKKVEEHTAAMVARAEAMKTFETDRKALLTKADDISSDLAVRRPRSPHL